MLLDSIKKFTLAGFEQVAHDQPLPQTSWCCVASVPFKAGSYACTMKVLADTVAKIMYILGKN